MRQTVIPDLAGPGPGGDRDSRRDSDPRYRPRRRQDELPGGTIHGIGPHDPATFATPALLLLAVATVASLLPALRAAQIDPARTLRQE